MEEKFAEITKRWRELEGKYKALMAHATSDDIRKAILREWLEERYKLLKQYRGKIETEMTGMTRGGQNLRVAVAVCREDGEVLYRVDDRATLYREEDRDDIDKLYLKLFGFLEGLPPSD